MISVITHNSISRRAFERSHRVYSVRLWVRRLLLWDFPRLSWKSKWNCIISSHWSLVPLIRFLWFHIIKTALELVFVCERQKASAWKIQFSSSRLVFIWTIESTCSALHTYYDILGRSQQALPPYYPLYSCKFSLMRIFRTILLLCVLLLLNYC